MATTTARVSPACHLVLIAKPLCLSCFYLTKTECHCTHMSGPFDPRAPACAWLEDGHTEDWSRGGCNDALSGGACVYREPEDGDPYLLVVFMLIVTACNIPILYVIRYLFHRIIRAPVLGAGGACLGTAAIALPRWRGVTTTAGANPPRTGLNGVTNTVSRAPRSVAAAPGPALTCALPTPSAELDTLLADTSLMGGVLVPALVARIEELVNLGASAGVVAADGSTLLHLFCGRCADVTPAQLALIVAAHPAQLTASDGRGRTPLHCLVSFATKLTPELLAPLLHFAAAIADTQGRTPLHAVCADRVAVRLDVLNSLFVAYPAAREQRNVAGLTPLECALGRDPALASDSIRLLTRPRESTAYTLVEMVRALYTAPAPSGNNGPATGRPCPPRITAAEARGFEVWLSISPPTEGGTHILRYEIETTSYHSPRRIGVTAHRPATCVAVGGLNDGASYDFRVRAVGRTGLGDWSCTVIFDTAGLLYAPRPSPWLVPTPAPRRDALAVVATGGAPVGVQSAARSSVPAPHAALRDVPGGGALRISRVLALRLRAQEQAQDTECEVRWRAQRFYVWGVVTFLCAAATGSDARVLLANSRLARC